MVFRAYSVILALRMLPDFPKISPFVISLLMAYPTCDVKTELTRLKLIQDGGQFVDLGQNISRNKADEKY